MIPGPNTVREYAQELYASAGPMADMGRAILAEVDSVEDDRDGRIEDLQSEIADLEDQLRQAESELSDLARERDVAVAEMTDELDDIRSVLIDLGFVDGASGYSTVDQLRAKFHLD